MTAVYVDQGIPRTFTVADGVPVPLAIEISERHCCRVQVLHLELQGLDVDRGVAIYAVARRETR